MIKRSTFRDNDISLLYEYARNDLFLNPIGANKTHQKLIVSSQQGPSTSSMDHQKGKSTTKAPSITAIFLLQLEVKLIQMISDLPAKPPRNAMFASVTRPVQQAVRWTFLFGLIVLDYVSRVLGVDSEMARLSPNRPDPIITPQPDQQQQQQHHHHQHIHQHHHYTPPQVDLEVVHLESSVVCFNEQSVTNANEDSDLHVEVTNDEDITTSRCNTCSPSKLPILNLKTSVSSRTGSSYTGHVRSLSNNMTLPAKHADSLGHSHSLRRIDGQRNLASVNASPALSSSSSLSHHHSEDRHCQDHLIELPRRSTSTHL